MFSSAALRFEVPNARLRQPVQELQIGGTGDKVPDFPALTHCTGGCSDGVGPAVMGICRIFESSLSDDLT
jgi:hypothetical protein